MTTLVQMHAGMEAKAHSRLVLAVVNVMKTWTLRGTFTTQVGEIALRAAETRRRTLRLS